MSLKTKIKAFAKELVIPLIGFAGVEPFVKEREYLKLRYSEGRDTPFEHHNIEKRTDITKLLPEAKTIIAVGLPYSSAVKKRDDGIPCGKVARYSLVKDYHQVVRNRMKELVVLIKKELAPEAKFKLFVDTAPPLDKAIAARAGLGWIGKNTLLITKEFGSYVVLGEIVTDLEIEPDSPRADGCGDCNRCLKACPTGALTKPYQINAPRCISYLTQSRNRIPADLRKTMGSNIYGCDACQEVCPYNHDIQGKPDPEFKDGLIEARPSLVSLLEQTDSDFERTFGKTAAGWVGKRTLERNAIIALANSGGLSPELIEKLEDAVEHDSDMGE